jgi:hypothetical protein
MGYDRVNLGVQLGQQLGVSLGVGGGSASVPEDLVDYYYWLVQGNEPWDESLGGLQRPADPATTDTIVVSATEGNVTISTNARRVEINGVITGELILHASHLEVVCTSNDASARRIRSSAGQFSHISIDGRRPNGSNMLLTETNAGFQVLNFIHNPSSSEHADIQIRNLDIQNTNGGAVALFRVVNRLSIVGVRAVSASGTLDGVMIDRSESSDILVAGCNFACSGMGNRFRGTRIVEVDQWLSHPSSGSDGLIIHDAEGVWIRNRVASRGIKFGSFFGTSEGAVDDVHVEGCEFFEYVAFARENTATVGEVNITSCTFRRDSYTQSTLNTQMSFAASGDISTGNTFAAGASISAPPDPPGDPEALLDPVPMNPALGTLYAWGRGDDGDAGINTTPDPDQYESIPNRGTAGGVFEQATSANQPQVSDIFTLPSPIFDGSGDRLVSSAAASAWTAFHDSTSDVTLTAVVRRNVNSVIETFFSTSQQGGSGSRGFSLRGHTNGRLQLIISNGSSTVYSQISGSNFFGATTIYVVQLVKSGTTVTVYIDGTSRLTGTMSGSSTSDAAHTLTVGGDRPDASLNPFGGIVAEWAVHLAAHDGFQRAAMGAYLTDKWVAA